MPLILRYRVDDATTLTGKAATLDGDAKTRRTVEIVAAGLLGDAGAEAMSAQEKLDFVAEAMGQRLRRMAQQYRSERIIREAQQAAAETNEI